jgi:putative hydrolase of the HAD superfamily
MSRGISNLEEIIERIAAKRFILLDLDNTIYAYDPCHESGQQAAWEVFHQDIDAKVELEEFVAAVDAARRDVKGRLSGTAACHSRLLYFQGALEVLAPKHPVVLALDLEAAYWDGYLDAIEPADWVPGFFDHCRREGKKVAIVSNLTTQIQMRKLRELEIEDRVDCLVTSEEFGAEKPDPGIFAYALRKLGGHDAEAILIGDDPQSDASASITVLLCDARGPLR